MRQYYYKVNACKATNARDPACFCWHDEGTGPLASEPRYIQSWREVMTEPLSDFQEGQWWVKELDTAAGKENADPDFVRAVAVVHHMLRAALAAAPAQPVAEPSTPAPVGVEPVAQWQKRHPNKEYGLWQNTDEGDAKWWRDKAGTPGWEARALYAAPAQPDTHMQELAAYRLTVENLERENAALREALKKANSQAEHFEREWYLRGDALEAALAGTAPAWQLTFTKEYEELRAIIDGGSESATHQDAVYWVRLAAKNFEIPANSPVPQEYAELPKVGSPMWKAVTNWKNANGGFAELMGILDVEFSCYADATYSLRTGGKP